MFNNLTDRFQQAFRNLTGRGRLTETNITDAMGEIRTALLDADVNYTVVKKFIADVREECLGESVMKSVTPGQQVIKIVNDKLVSLLGENSAPLDLSGSPSIIMLCGLHGSGKTTTSAKLAKYMKDDLKQRVMLAACDLYRPAAIDQLSVLAQELDVPVYVDRETKDVTRVAQAALNEARAQNVDVLILDTAGRLQIDEDLVQELIDIKKKVKPNEILLVGDSALGQEAVSVAEHFDRALGVTGMILTKLDGDARGGAALSMHQVTGKPIKFVTTGERPMDFEKFYPDRMASRILGMGDVVSLVERAQKQFEEEETEKLEERLMKNEFGFDDFLSQIAKIKKMGGLMSLLRFLPGMSNLPLNNMVSDSSFNRFEGIINSMTLKERRHPEIINQSRKLRISKGAGVPLQEVSDLLKHFQQMRQMMAQMGKSGLFGGGMPNMSGMGGGLGGMPSMGGMPGMPGMPGMGGGVPTGMTAKQRQKNAAEKKKQKQARKHGRKK